MSAPICGLTRDQPLLRHNPYNQFIPFFVIN